MHVLQAIEATIGGTRRHAVDVCRGLAAAGERVTLVASALREPGFRADLEALAAAGVRVVELPMVRSIRPGMDLAHLRALERLLRRERPDVVHTHSSKAGVLGRLAALSTGVGARVHTPHTFAFLFRSMFSAPQRALFRELERALCGVTDRVLAVGEGEAETMRASGVVPPERVRVVPNGVDPAPFLQAWPADLAALGVPRGAPCAAVIGLLNVAKGQDLALRALREPGCERAHLLLAGHGEQRPALEALARELGVAGRAHFLGWRRDVPELLAAVDVLLLPSRWEGMPYIVLEAFASGKPVVATRVDGARELVEEGRSGFLVDLESPAQLGGALARVLALPAERREALGRAGRERVLASGTLDTMIARLRAVYAEVA